MKKTKFEIMDKYGRTKTTHEIDITKVKSPDPLAYIYGKVQGERGEPLSKDKDLAPEYIRGWKEGSKTKKKRTRKSKIKM